MTTVSVLPSCAPTLAASANETSPPVRVARHQGRLGEQQDRGVPPRAERSLRVDGERRVGQHLFGTRCAHHGVQHGARRGERRGALQGNAVPRSGVHDGGPPLGFRGAPVQDGGPARQDGQRRVALDAGIAQRREPLLDGGDLSGAVGREDDARHQLDASVPLGGIQQVLDRQLGRAVRLVPVGRAQVELGDDLGFAALQLAEQELAEQRMVAVPLSPAVERSHEQAPGLQLAEHRLRAGALEDGIAQGTRQLIEHGRPSQEPLEIVGQAGERLPVEVVGHVAILTTHVPRLEPAVPRDQRGEVEPRRPTLGASDHRGGRLDGQVDPCIREDLSSAGRVEREITPPRSPARPPTRGAAARGAARIDSPRRTAIREPAPRSRRPTRRGSLANAPRGDRPPS